MLRLVAVFLGIFAVACSQEVDDHTHALLDHTHPLVEHEHSHDLLQHDHDHQHPFVNHSHADETGDAVIVNIDPPLIDDGPLDNPLKSNGSLKPRGFQTITVIFSEKPQGLTVTNDDPDACECAVSPVFEWTLQDRTLELKAFCGEGSGSTRVTLEWHSGAKTLRYLCQN